MLYHTLQAAVDACRDLNDKPGFPEARVYHCGPDGRMGGKGCYTVVRAYRHPWAGNAELVFIGSDTNV